MERYSFYISSEGAGTLKKLTKFTKIKDTNVTIELYSNRICCGYSPEPHVTAGITIYAEELKSYFTLNNRSITVQVSLLSEALHDANVSSEFIMYCEKSEYQTLFVVLKNGSAPCVTKPIRLVEVKGEVKELDIDKFSDNFAVPAIRANPSCLRPVKSGINKKSRGMIIETSMIGIANLSCISESGSPSAVCQIEDNVRTGNFLHRTKILGEEIDEIDYYTKTSFTSIMNNDTCALLNLMKDLSSSLVSFIPSNDYQELLILTKMGTLGEIYAVIGAKEIEDIITD